MERIDDLPILPNRLGVAEFNPREMGQILGVSVKDQELAKDNYNWLAAYLVEEVGIYEDEVPEWFKSRARGLDNERPIDIWKEADGFIRVFDYAQQYRDQVLEDLGEDPADSTYMQGIARSHRLGIEALKVIFAAFEIAGIAKMAISTDRDYAIYNPEIGDSLVASWRPRKGLQHYRIDRTSAGGDRLSRYFIVFVIDGLEGQILQTGTGEFVTSNGHTMSETDSDLDGRAPSAGEVARFVVPLANEVRNRTLVMMESR